VRYAVSFHPAGLPRCKCQQLFLSPAKLAGQNITAANSILRRAALAYIEPGIFALAVLNGKVRGISPEERR
jgi:hypothetical protein